MNVSELHKLTVWVSEEIETTQIPQLYNALYQVLSQNSTQASKLPLEPQKESLIVALKNVNLERLTRDQITFLRELGIAEYVSEEGISNIEDILYKNSLDVATAAQRFQEIHQKTSEGLAKSNQIKTGLINVSISEDYEIDNHVLMRVTFTGDAKMGNIIDLKDWGKIWFDIGRGITLAHDVTPEDIKIVGASRGSIVIEFAVLAPIAGTFGAIIFWALTVAEKVLGLKKTAEEIRGMRLTNNIKALELAQSIEDTAEAEKTAGIEEISIQITKQLKIKTKSEGDKVNALNTAIKNLVNFIQKGGEVDFVVPETEAGAANEDANMKELRNKVQEIRKLEEKIALLEHKKMD